MKNELQNLPADKVERLRKELNNPTRVGLAEVKYLVDEFGVSYPLANQLNNGVLKL